MSKHNNLSTMPEHPEDGAPVGARYSFFNEAILRVDTVHKQGPVERRILTYTKPKKEEKKIRNALAAGGYVLGREFANPDKNLNSFIIPGSARPIIYESPSRGEGPYEYSDTSLFLNLGQVLGRLAAAGPQDPLVTRGSIGLNTAIMEFTRINEQKLLLVPGFELGLKAVRSDDSALSHYSIILSEDFGDERFAEHEASFIDGFESGITSLE